MALAGAIVPHAPLLTLASADEGVDRARAAVGALELGPGTVVVLSPHGSATGVYARAAGSLREFGIPGGDVKRGVDRGLARDLASSWGRPMLDDDVDHGIAVPLALLARTERVVAASLDEALSHQESIDGARSFAAALGGLGGVAAFVASAHTSSALSPRAPLGRSDVSAHAAEGFRRALEHGEGIEDAALLLARAGASCGAAPLVAFAALFPTTACEVVASEAPFGVGYVVARTLDHA